PLMEGALEAILEMSRTPNEIFICTAPYLANPACTDDKLYWIGKHLGREWKNRTIITSDKTVVHSDILIDDRPEIAGVQKPTWEQILYTQPYNLHITDKRRLTWKDWKSVLNL
ncbi:MAG: 5'-3'-deoxyribonucleotidase, partial [Nanoarchaeota archaeon]